MITADYIRRLIEQGLNGATVQVTGEDGQHFEAIIVYEGFTDKTMLQQHQMVYTALGPKMGAEIHALSMKTLTPQQAIQQNILF